MLRRLKALRRCMLGVLQSRSTFEARVKAGFCVLLLFFAFNLLVSLFDDGSIYNWLFGWYVIDENYGRLAAENTIAESRNRVTLESICSALSANTCFSVVDVFDEKMNEVRRVIFVKGFDNEYDSQVRLIPPTGLNFRDSDTRTWRIDHFTVHSQYIASLIASPFMVGALSLETKKNARRSILNVGLGGGSLDMFFHKAVPEVNITVVELEPAIVSIAHRWFGVEEDSLRRTIVGNGVEVLEKSEKSSFDVVIIDACDESHRLPCPAAAFRNEKVFENAKRVLKPMGCLVVNVLALKYDGEVADVMKLLRSHFPVCISGWLPDEYNVPVICVPYALENSESSLLLFKKRFQKAAQQFEFDSILNDVVFKLLECRRRFGGRKGRCNTYWSRISHIVSFHSTVAYNCPIPACTIKHLDVYQIGGHLKAKHPRCEPAYRKIYKNQVRRSKNLAINKVERYFPVTMDGLKTEEQDEESQRESADGDGSDQVEIEELRADGDGSDQVEIEELRADESRSSADSESSGCSGTIVQDASQGSRGEEDNSSEEVIVTRGKDAYTEVMVYNERFGISTPKLVEWRPSVELFFS